MRKRYRKFIIPTMRRSSRVFIDGYVNPSKLEKLRKFLFLCRDVSQFFTDIFWQRKDGSSALADIHTIHRGTKKFGITTRLAQAIAKQAKETVRSTISLKGSKPEIKSPTVVLSSNFVMIEKFHGSFDYAVKIGRQKNRRKCTDIGAPSMVVPIKSTNHLNDMVLLGDWKIGKSIRLGMKKGRIYIDFLLEKPAPKKKDTGDVVGLDSNYKSGLCLSDGQQVGADNYAKIQTFHKREKHKYKQVKDMLGAAIKRIDFSKVKTLCIENLKSVRSNTRGKFPRTLNRRMSHWLYAYTVDLLERRCEELGIRLERKDPWKTSQCCPVCGKWDRRNRNGDKFLCIHCGHSDHADFNASKVLALLGVAEVYGLRSLPSPVFLDNHVHSVEHKQ